MEDFTEQPPVEEVTTVPEQQGPPNRLRQTFDYIKEKKLEGVADALPDSYEEFEAGMADPDNVKALHSLFKDQKWEGSELKDNEFADFVLEGVKKKAQSGPSSPPAGASGAMPGPSPALSAQDEAEQQMGAFVPAGPLTPQALDEEFTEQPQPAGVPAPAASLVPAEIPDAQQVPEDVRLTPEPGQPTALPPALAATIDELPAAPQLDTVVGENGQVLDVRRRADEGFQPVDVTELAAQLPDTAPVYRVMNGDQQRLYYDRPLSKMVDGKEQTVTEAAFRNFGNQLLTMGQGGLDYLGAADRKLHATTVGQFLDSMDMAAGRGAYNPNEPNIFQAGADAIERTKGEVAPFYAASEFRATKPNTWAMATSNVAALALPALVSVAFPEGRAAEAVQAIAGAGFDMQMLEGSFQRARAAGMKGEQLDNYALADGAATMLVFKLGGLGLNAAAQKLAKTELMQAVAEQVKTTGGRLSEGALGEGFAKAAPRVAAILKSSAAEGGTMGTLMAANAVKEKVGERVANQLLGRPAFPEQSLGQDAADVAGAFGEGVVLGGSLGGIRGLRAPTPTAVPLGESPTRGPLYAEFGPDRLTVRYLDAHGGEVDFGPAGPPPAVHQAVGAARALMPKPPTNGGENAENVRENTKNVLETAQNGRETTQNEAGPADPAPTGDVAGAPAAVEPGAAAGGAPEGATSAGEKGPVNHERGTLILYESTTGASEGFAKSAEEIAALIADIRAGTITPESIGDRLPGAGNNTINEAKEALKNGTLADELEAALETKNKQQSGRTAEQASSERASTARRIDEYKKDLESPDFATKLEEERDQFGDRTGRKVRVPLSAESAAKKRELAKQSIAEEEANLKKLDEELAGFGGTTESVSTPAPAYATPAENRARGRFEKDGVTYTRQQPLAEKAARGTAATAEFSTGVQQPVQYAVMEAADLQPSHTGGNPNLTHFLPEAQPKNRSAQFDPASQKAIADIAAAPDLGRLGEAPNAYSGAPIVNGRGEALQGNGRAEGIRQHYQQGGESYRADVVAAAEKAGIPAEQTARFRQPVLVRIADVSDARARELGNYTAADTESGGKRRLDARQAAGRMSEEDRGTLTRLATPRGEATLTETVRGNTEEILRFLRKSGLVNETQLQTLVKPDGTLTPQGVEDIAGLYRHQLFQEGDPNLPELFAELPAAAQGGLDRAVGALLGVPESASLVPEVQDAIGGVREFLSSGADFATWAGQADMFRGGAAPRNRYTPLTLKLIELLASEKRPTYIARLFNEYAAAVKGEAASLFGETPPKPRAEAVQETFGVRDEPANRNPGGEESAPRPVDAAQRPTAPVAPDAPGPGAAAEPAAEPAAAPDGAAPAGGAAAAAPDAGPERGAVAPVQRRIGGYEAGDGTLFKGVGAKVRAETHNRQLELVGRRVRAYDGTVDVIEGVKQRAGGGGYDYTVRGEADGQVRVHGTEPQAKDLLPAAPPSDAARLDAEDKALAGDVSDTNVGEMAAQRPTQQRLQELDSELEELKTKLAEAKRGNPMGGRALATLVPLPTITPAEASIYVQMATNRIRAGVVKVADLVAQLKAALGANVGSASDDDLRTVVQYALDERAEEADLTRAAVLADLEQRQADLETSLLGSATATDADFSATSTGKATGLLSRAQEKLISEPLRKVGAGLNRLTSRAAVGKNAFARELVYAVNAVTKGFVQTREQQLRSEAFIGQARERPAKEAEVLYKGFTERLRDASLTDPVAQGAALRESLRRIDRVLDPSFYEARTRDGFEALLQERLTPEDFADLSTQDIDELFTDHTALLSAEQLAAAGALEPDDLSPAERAVHDQLKELYNFVHDANFAIGRVSYTTWEAGRDMNTGEATYAARLYNDYELPDDLAPKWKQAMGGGGRRLETGMYQQRQELEAWKIANKVEDPVFAAVKRLRQTMANRAIHDYSQWLSDTQPQMVVRPRNGGAKAQEAARLEGEGRGFVQLGEGYGALSGAWVAPHVAEDFKGGFFTNAFMQRIYEVTQAYGSGNAEQHLLAGSLGQVRNLLKKTVTVYNPGTHMGNMLNNVTLGWFAGVDGVSMAAEQVGAVQELRDYSPTVRYLLDRGVLGGSLASGEFKTNLESFESAFAPAPPKSVVARGLGKMEEFYQATDTVAKVALFRALVKQGLSAEAAADRVATALQNNKRVGKAYDVGANVPLVGQAFVRWSADLARILGSAAVNRPLSVAAFAVGLRTLGTALSQQAGETDAERRLREANASRIPLPAWLGGNVSTSLKLTKNTTVDFSRWFIPFYLYGGYDDDEVGGEVLSKFAPIWLKGAGHFVDGEFSYTSNPAGARAVTMAKITADPLLGPLAQLALDADFRGKSIADPNQTASNPSTATPLEKQAAQAHFFLRSALPGVGPLLDDVYQAARSRENYFGKKRSVGQTLARFLGFKAEQFGTMQYYQALVRTTLTAQRQMEAELKLTGQVPDDVLKGMLNHSVNIHQLVPRLRYRSQRFSEAYVKYAAAQQLARDFLDQQAKKAPAAP